MSLQLAAQHLAARGRGPDTTLVHMTPKEVEGLQALAMRHGGSLTINPQTGLPEAGFLSSILPLVAGVGLTAMGMPAGMAALTVGGGTAAITGDLKKGLMAGIGAYGGASLSESLIGSGAAGLAPEAAAAATNAVPVETAAQIAPTVAAPAAPAASVASTVTPAGTPIAAMNPAEFNLRYGFSPPPTVVNTTPAPPVEAVVKAPSQTVTSQPEMYTKGAYLPNSAATMSPANMTVSQRLDALKAGATGKNLLNYAKANPLQTAGMLYGPLMAASENNNAPSKPVGDSDRGAMANAGYEYDPGWSNPMPSPDPYGREQVYNRPRYRIPTAADGGAVQHFDNGGVVDRASQSPLLKQFIEDQAAMAAQSAPEQIDVKQQFADYLKAQSAPIAGTTTSSYKPPIMERLPAPAALSTAGISSLMPESIGPTGTRGGLSFESQQIKDDQEAWTNLGEDGQAAYFAVNPGMLGFHEGVLNVWSGSPLGMIQNAFDPGRQNKERAMIANARGRIAADKAMQGFGGSISGSSGAAPGSSTTPALGTINTQGSEGVGGWGSRDAGGGNGGSGFQGSGAAPGSSTAPAAGANNNANPGWGSRDAGGAGDARGGYLDNGKFDQRYANGGGITALAQGGYNLGSYSDGGRLLRGPGDGVSDSIPAVIGQKQPARLADGEFVIPARIVSEIGNGSTEAGARKLYAMMDRVQKSRGKTVGKGKVAKNTRADKYLPA